MSRKDGKKSGKEDEATMYKNLCIEKDLEIIVMEDKCRKLETRSMHVEDMIESLSKTTDEKIKNLEEIVLYLNVEEAKKDEKISKLEVQVQKLETDMQEAIESLQKQLEDDKGHHEFQVNSLNLQLEAANVKLREMSDFAVRKAAMEAELVLLKEQLLKEQRDHAEAISDVERNAVTERERLKKEIITRVEETKQMMTRLMEEQLHQKTKRTITENEQLRKEVSYHTRQTDMLLQKNEKLAAENIDLHRSLILAKELEDDLSLRNHMYQKTTRILVYKLRERDREKKAEEEKADDVKLEEEEEELKAILSTVGGDSEPVEQTKKVGSEDTKEVSDAAKTGEEAMKFLYACLEDLELERLIDAKEKARYSDLSPLSSYTHVDTSISPEGIKRLDTMNLDERRDIMKKLLRAAAALRSVTDDMVGDTLDYSKFAQATPPITTIGNTRIRVDDILEMPVDKMKLDHPARIYAWMKPTTAAVQADLTQHAIRSRSPTLF